MNKDRLRIAERHGERNSTEWHDFCANYGHIPDNVRHLRPVLLAFAGWLEGNESV